MGYTYITQYQNTLNYDLTRFDIILFFEKNNHYIFQKIYLINAIVNITTFSENILIPELPMACFSTILQFYWKLYWYFK